ncbi:hypothetical protein JKF63_04814 [Porcisia hertigi]|uniref:Transmembrane protein n=1 Tax=Porcisia hertigi TaxID=2761500 RepID=A0A836LDM6_9TRYP|nr:hypothetical protein JKF63_04814 [Porcisia hertigi]
MKRQLRFIILAALTLVLCSIAGLAVGSGGAGSGTRTLTAVEPFSGFVGRARDTLEHALAPIAEKALPCVPSSVVELAPIFAHGAASLVVVGRGARRPLAVVSGTNGDEVLQHTTEKFVYAAGAIIAEIALLQLVYREPYRNLRKNRANYFFSTATGFVVLVLLTAFPNDLVDTSLVCIFYFKLSSQVYVPAVVCGQLLRVYMAALVPALPPLSAAYTALLAYWSDHLAEGLSSAQVREACAELVLASMVMGAFLFSFSARHGASEATSPIEPESDGDDYYCGEQ